MSQAEKEVLCGQSISQNILDNNLEILLNDHNDHDNIWGIPEKE